MGKPKPKWDQTWYPGKVINVFYVYDFYNPSLVLKRWIANHRTENALEDLLEEENDC